MSAELLKQIVFAGLSFVFLVVSYQLGARGKLSFRYTTGWILLFSVGLFSALLIPIVGPLAEKFKLSPVAVVAGVGVVLLIAICVQLSVSISGLQEQIRSLSEDLAIQQIESSEIPPTTESLKNND